MLIQATLLCLASFAFGEIGEPRVWTDTQGREIKAQLLKIEAEAILIKVGTKEFLMDLNKLSDADQEFVRKMRPRVRAGQIGAMRKWTDVKGRQIEARLMRIIDKDTVQITVGAKEYTMRLANLSDADKQYVDKLRPAPPAGKVSEYPIEPREEMKTWLAENHMQSLQWTGVPRPGAEEFTLPFQLHAPPETDENRNRKIPLLVHLHGTGGIGKDNVKQFSDGGGVAKMYMSPSFQSDQATYIMIPQTAQMSGWYALSFTDPSYELRAIVHAIRLLAETPGYRVDLSQIYVTGLSMGGAGAFQAMAKFPGFFAGAVPISYVDTPKIYHEGNVGPMWVVINRGDGNYEERLKSFRAHYEAMGGTIHTTVNAKKGHDAWTSLIRDQKFRDWLFRRTPEMFEK